MSTHDNNLRFASDLFSDNAHAGDEKDQGASEYTDEQRRWVRGLFADDEDSPILAGLTNGKTTGRWQHND